MGGIRRVAMALVVCCACGKPPPMMMTNPPPTTVTFRVTVPANTPSEALVMIVSGALELPMKPLGGNRWELSVAPSALSMGQLSGATFEYVYSRGMRYMGGEELPGDPDETKWNLGRKATVTAGAVIEDVVARWRFMPPDGTPLPTMNATLSTVAPRLGGAKMEKGAELVDFYWTDMPALFDGTIAHMKAAGMTWVQLAPPWDYTQTMPLPVIGSVVSQAEYTDQQLRDESLAFAKGGIQVAYRVQVCCTPVPDTSGVSSAWWDAWFATYQAFLVHHAQIAQATGVGRIALAYPNVGFALPGMPTAAPDAEARWRAMMPGVRAVYNGRIGYDLLVIGGAGSYNLPGEWNGAKVIADLFDFWGIGLWQGYVSTSTATQQEIDAGVDATFAAAMDAVYQQSPKPQILTSVAAASYDGAAINMIGNDVVLNNTYGPESANMLTYDGLEQAMMYQSILRAVASRPFIVGFYPFNYRYVPASAAPDWSVRGKAAEGVISSWYGAF